MLFGPAKKKQHKKSNLYIYVESVPNSSLTPISEHVKSIDENFKQLQLDRIEKKTYSFLSTKNENIDKNKRSNAYIYVRTSLNSSSTPISRHHDQQHSDISNMTLVKGYPLRLENPNRSTRIHRISLEALENQRRHVLFFVFMFIAVVTLAVLMVMYQK